MGKELWKPKDWNIVSKIIEELLSFTSSTGIHPPDYHRYEILMQELIALSVQKLNYALVIGTLIESKKQNVTDVQGIGSIYTKFFAEIRKKEKEWTVILPYRNHVLKNQFKILDLDYKTVDQRQLKKVVDYKRALEEINKYRHLRTEEYKLPALFLQVQVRANNIISCWKYILPSFSVFQGIYDLGLSKGSWIETKGAITSFQHPEWVLAQDSDGKIELDTFLIYGKTLCSPLNLTRVKPTITLLNIAKYKANSKTTKGIIYDCLRLYAQAMESVDKFNCFLHFWQLLENACVAENQGGSTKEVIKRLKVICEETKPFEIPIDGICDSLIKKRNDLVHKGINNANNHFDVNILKLLSEKSIDWLMSKEKYLKTESHIKEYFNLRTKGDSDKRAILETIKHLNWSKALKEKNK